MADDLRRSPMLHALRALQFKSAGRAQGGDYFSAELSLTIPEESNIARTSSSANLLLV